MEDRIPGQNGVAGLRGRSKMALMFPSCYRHPRESGGPEPAPGLNLIVTHKYASDSQAHPPTMAERRTGAKRLHRCRACFETRSVSALSMRAVLDGIKKIPQPEEAAQRPSRRPHGADPPLCGLHDLRGGLTRDDCAQSHLWVKVRTWSGQPRLRRRHDRRPGRRG
jgi:hypothetical protein